jgi:hypothetical protein
LSLMPYSARFSGPCEHSTAQHSTAQGSTQAQHSQLQHTCVSLLTQPNPFSQFRCHAYCAVSRPASVDVDEAPPVAHNCTCLLQEYVHGCCTMVAAVPACLLCVPARLPDCLPYVSTCAAVVSSCCLPAVCARLPAVSANLCGCCQQLPACPACCVCVRLPACHMCQPAWLLSAAACLSCANSPGPSS